jgi:osmoprotectant transport system ATP-binding protein
VRATGKTALIVTHDLAEAGYLGDTVVLMDRGQVVQQEPFRSLLDAPVSEFVRRFVEAQRSPVDENAS